jgi:hypothetical protein
VTDVTAVTATVIVLPVVTRTLVVDVVDLARTPARLVVVVLDHAWAAVVVTMVMMAIHSQYMANDRARNGAGNEHADAIIVRLCR